MGLVNRLTETGYSLEGGPGTCARALRIPATLHAIRSSLQPTNSGARASGFSHAQRIPPGQRSSRERRNGSRRQPVRRRHRTARPLTLEPSALPGFDHIDADIRPKRFRHHHASIRLLKIFHDRYPGPPDRESASVQRVDIFALLPRPHPYGRSPGLVGSKFEHEEISLYPFCPGNHTSMFHTSSPNEGPMSPVHKTTVR